jgi:hypothetical protein
MLCIIGTTLLSILPFSVKAHLGRSRIALASAAASDSIVAMMSALYHLRPPRDRHSHHLPHLGQHVTYIPALKSEGSDCRPPPRRNTRGNPSWTQPNAQTHPHHPDACGRDRGRHASPAEHSLSPAPSSSSSGSPWACLADAPGPRLSRIPDTCG